MRGMLMLVVTGGLLALAGTPVPEPGWSLLFSTTHFVTASLAGIAMPGAGGGAASGTGAASLLMLAGGFFGAAAIVRRRQ